MRLLTCVLAFSLSAAMATDGRCADDSAPRQKYSSGWKHVEGKNYYYREYLFKSRPDDAEYQHHYVLYFKDHPQRKNWLYFYNPKVQKVWARYPTAINPTYKEQIKAGRELWSMLPVKERKMHVEDIANTAYQEPGSACPTIPGSDDNTNIEQPPTDLP